MKQKTYKRKILKIVVPVIILILVASTVAGINFGLPTRIMLLENDEYKYDLKLPSFITAVANDVLYPGESGNESPISLYANNDITTINPIMTGETNIVLKLFGLIPLKNVAVKVLPDNFVYAGGDSIGLALRANGLFVIETSTFNTKSGDKISPAEQAGLKKGDIVLSCNGRNMTSSGEFVGMVKSSDGKPVELKCIRDGVYFDVKLNPQLSEDDEYKIGMWVRDGADGIGTLTFIDKSTGIYGSLGHGINDSDLNRLFTVGIGEALHAKIISVEKGAKGNPGELKGIFVNGDNPFGDIRTNCSTGVYGKIEDNTILEGRKQYRIGLNYEIVEGPAKILTTVDEEGIKEFDINIDKIYRNRINSPKSMVIHVTDQELINKTGGIVQGMSGSPIIQNGKIIGAVTHVLVNDPTSGYGIFIESMLTNVKNASQTKPAA